MKWLRHTFLLICANCSHFFTTEYALYLSILFLCLLMSVNTMLLQQLTITESVSLEYWDVYVTCKQLYMGLWTHLFKKNNTELSFVIVLMSYRGGIISWLMEQRSFLYHFFKVIVFIQVSHWLKLKLILMLNVLIALQSLGAVKNKNNI